MEDIQKKEIHFMPPNIVVKALTIALAALALLAFVQILIGLREYKYIGAGVSATNTISVSGEGEVFAVPDIATFSLSVTEEAKEVEDAQSEATKKTNDIIDYLKKSGVEDRDVKTTNYNVYPRYEWRETSSTGVIRPGGERVLVGFEVTQSLSVKIRDTEKAGEILSGVGTRGVTDVSGLSFTIDDEDDLKDEAREMAIDDAKEKAEDLAKDLGVDLIRIVGFNEGGGGYPVLYARAESLSLDSAKSASIPDIQVGENKITSNVTITYEIR
jgi:uncharacterized protein